MRPKLIYFGLFIFLAFFVMSAFSQSPGNVSTNLKLWVRSDSGVITTPGNQVTQWNNQIANPTITLQASKPATPHVVLLPNQFNYNPSVVFDGFTSEELVGNASAANWTGALTMYCVINYTGTTPISPYYFPGVWDSNYKGLLGYDNYWFVDGYEASGPYTAAGTSVRPVALAR